MEKCQENDCQRPVNGLTEGSGTSRKSAGKPTNRALGLRKGDSVI